MEAIYAVDVNDGLSKNGVIPWHSKKDLRFFMKQTRHHVVIMGRRTYFSLPKRPLPDRLNIVLTNHVDDYKEEERKVENANTKVIFTDKAHLSSVIPSDNAKKVFVIGGKDVYEQLLPLCNVAWVTRIKRDYACDLFFSIGLQEEDGEIIEEDDDLVIRKYILKKTT